MCFIVLAILWQSNVIMVVKRHTVEKWQAVLLAMVVIPHKRSLEKLIPRGVRIHVVTQSEANMKQ